MKHGIVALAFVLSAAVLAAGPSSAEAGMLTVKPEAFRLKFSNQSSSVSPRWATSSDTSPVTYWAPVKLPPRARVYKLELFSWGTGTPHTRASLLRTKVGEGYSLYGPSKLMDVEDTTVNDVVNPPTVTPTTAKSYLESDLVVRGGYRYFVQVDVGGNTSFAKGVRIHYR